MTFDEAEVDQLPDPAPAVEEVLRGLDTPKGILPIEAIRTAQQLGPRIVPGLISRIREATAAAREDRLVETNGHFFALFLLTEFRAKEAWPAILEAMTLPGEWSGLLFGDGIHYALPQAVAAMAHDRVEEIVSVVRNVEVDEFVRWAMLSGLAMCVIDGSHSRAEIVELLRGLLRECLTQQGADNAVALVSTLTDLYPAEAYEEIQKAFDEELVWQGEVSREEVSEQIEMGEEATLKKLAENHRPVTDTVDILRHWGSFQPQERHRRLKPILRPADDKPYEMDPEEPVKPVRESKPRIGRNDPCPCGSGKKFKKCCLR